VALIEVRRRISSYSEMRLLSVMGVTGGQPE